MIFKHSSALVFALILLLVSIVSSNTLSDEAWTHYRESLKKVLSVQTDAKRVFTLVPEPMKKEEFMSRLNYAQEEPDSGDSFIVSPFQTQCQRAQSKITNIGISSLFLEFKRNEDKCSVIPTNVSTRPASNFQIIGSTLVTEKGRLVHQRRSFISSNRKEFTLKAFDLNGLGACKSVVEPQFYNRFWKEMLNKALFEVMKRLQGNDDDLASQDESISTFIDQFVDKYDNDESPDDDEFLVNIQELVKKTTLLACYNQRLTKMIINHEPLSLKEFELNYHLDKLEVVDVSNAALPPNLASTIRYGLMPRQVLVAHNPRVRMSLSHEDFTSLKKEFDSQKAIVVSGMKFDRMSIIRQSDDDDTLIGNMMEKIKQLTWAAKGAECASICLKEYEDSKDLPERREFKVSQCICKCREIYDDKNGYKNPQGAELAAQAKCFRSSHPFVVELKSSGTEVLAVISDRYN